MAKKPTPKFTKKPEASKSSDSSPAAPAPAEHQGRSGFRDPLVQYTFGICSFVILGFVGFYVAPQLQKISALEEDLTKKAFVEQLKPHQDNLQRMVVERTLEKVNASNKSFKKFCDAFLKDVEGKKMPTVQAACKEISTTAESLMADFELPRKAEAEQEIVATPPAEPAAEPAPAKPAPKTPKAEKKSSKKATSKEKRQPKNEGETLEHRTPAAGK